MKNSILWILICLLAVSSAALMLPEEELQRFKRSQTTICVEVRPTRAQQEPYYMCKGGDMPVAQNTATLRPFTSEKFLTTNKPSSIYGFNADRDVSTRGQTQLGQQPILSNRPQFANEFNLQKTNQQSSLAFADPKQQVWSFARAKQQSLQTQPLLQQTLQPEPTALNLGLYAENAAYFPQGEKPFQTFQTQYRYQPTQHIEYENFAAEKAPNSFIPRHSNSYSETGRGSAFPFTTQRSNFRGEPGPANNYRLGAATENDRANDNEQFPAAYPAALDQLVSMDGSSYEPFTGVARPNAFQTGVDLNRESIPNQDILFRDVANFHDLNTFLPNEFTAQQQPVTPVNLFVDVASQDLRALLNPPLVPAEYMHDPVIRTFYSSKVQQNSPAQAEVKNETPSTTPRTQQEETKIACPACENADETLEDDFDNYSMEKVATRGPCPAKDFNWPPVVIAMPCCGQQTSTPTPPIPPAGYFNPYSMPMLGMFPSFMPAFNPTGLEHANYAQAYQHPNYQTGSTASFITSQSRTADNENHAHEETTAKTTTAATEAKEEESLVTTTKVKESTTEKIIVQLEADSEKIATEAKDEAVKTEPAASTEDSTTTAIDDVADNTTTTEAADTLKLKDEPPKTFQTMLNRAKTFKELAEAGLKQEAENNNGKKGKRQNFKDANTALRTIAEVVAASNKRKYSTMIH